MLLTLIKKEILEHLMSLRFGIVTVLCFSVILCSVFVRCRDFKQVQDEYHQEVANLEGYNKVRSGPWTVLFADMTVLQRPSPLRIFVRGIDSVNGAILRPWAAASFPIFPMLQNTAVPLFASIDLVTFVGLVMSLMALLFGYDAVCGEKERGTLRLMLSYNVPRHAILLAKWIGGYITLSLPFILAVISGVLLVLIQPEIGLNRSEWIRLACILLLSLLYIGVVYSLAIFVSCLTARASTSIIALLSLWVALVLAAPNLAPYVAQFFRPVANAQEMENARRVASNDIRHTMKRNVETYCREKGFTEETIENLRFDPPNLERWLQFRVFCTNLERDALLQQIDLYAKMDQRYGAEIDAQTAISRRIGRMSPYFSFTLAATDMAGAGVTESNAFMEQVTAYERQLCVYAYNELDLWHQNIAASRDPNPKWVRAEQVPEFSYVPPAPAKYARAVYMDTALLIGAGIILSLFSYLAFLRYDVR